MYELFKEAVLASGLDVLNQTLDVTEDDYCRIKSAFCRRQVMSNSFQKQQMGCGQVLDLIVA